MFTARIMYPFQESHILHSLHSPIDGCLADLLLAKKLNGPGCGKSRRIIFKEPPHHLTLLGKAQANLVKLLS